MFNTGKVPGKAKSTGQACTLGSAPKAILAPLNIFECVLNCACVSRPITTSQFDRVMMRLQLDYWLRVAADASLCCADSDLQSVTFWVRRNNCQ